MHRATSLVKGDENHFESLEDTFKDLACYSIMNLIEMKARQQGPISTELDYSIGTFESNAITGYESESYLVGRSDWPVLTNGYKYTINGGTELANGWFKDANGNYVVVDESCVPKVGQINVVPMYTPITSCFNHYYDEECTTNATTKEEILGWRAITDKLFTFTYTGYFPGYNTFFNDVIYMANQFKWYAEHDIRFDFYYPEGNTSDISIMMTPLKVFLRSELAWNPYQDVNELIHDFMMHYYGVGGEDVEKYFYALNEHYEYIYNTIGTSCVFALSTISAAKYWPRSTLLTFETYMQNAMAKNELSDYTEQDKKIYHDRLFKEYFLVYYNEYLFYSAYFTTEEKELAQRYIDEYVPKYYIPM